MNDKLAQRMKEFEFVDEEWSADIQGYSEVTVSEPNQEYSTRTYGFERLSVWKKAIEFVEWVYTESKNLPSEEKFHLTSQLRRAATSVPSNIAEGTSRSTNKDKIHFLNIAYSSLIELINHLVIVHRLGYMDQENYLVGRRRVQELTAMVAALSRSFGRT